MRLFGKVSKFGRYYFAYESLVDVDDFMNPLKSYLLECRGWRKWNKNRGFFVNH
jgi:hypothetical protein